MSPSSTAIATPAAIRGHHLRRTSGWLVAERGRIEFRTATAPVFRVRVAEVEAVAWPWWGFGTRLVITVRGERYRITFGATDDQADSDTDSTETESGLLDIVIMLVQLVVSLRGWFRKRSAARPWRQLLAPIAG